MLGAEGEEKARHVLKRLGYSVTQVDWLGVKDGTKQLYRFEVKAKNRLFTPPPFYGHGFDLHQVQRFLRFQELTGIRVVMLFWESWHDKWLWAFLDDLEASDRKCMAPFGQIRVYARELFIEL